MELGKQDDYEKAARCIKMLSNPTRLKILCTLEEGPKSVREINKRVETTQANLSQHLILMRDRGILKSSRTSNFVYYSIADPNLTAMLQLIKRMFCCGTEQSD